MLKPFGPDIRIAEGPVVSATLGFRYPTRMAAIRLPNAEGAVAVFSSGRRWR